MSGLGVHGESLHVDTSLETSSFGDILGRGSGLSRDLYACLGSLT